MAIPPTIIILLNFEIKFFIILILEEILEPPIIQVIGFLISEVILVNASISKSNWRPEYEVINFVISKIEACAL